MDGEQSDASWDSEEDYPRYCVSRRCRLCRFAIVSGETVVAAIDGSRVSSSFVYGTIGGHWDKKLQTDFIHCFPACNHTRNELDGPAFGYHAECLAFASSTPSAAYLRATGYAFEPMPWQDRQRQHRIKHLLAGRLGAMYPALPAEVWLMVARHLVRPCAITTTETLWAARESYDCCVDMSKDVWARYVHIDGIRYLAALSNHQKGAGIHSCKLVDAGSVSQSTMLYILQDHLGVRQLVLIGPNASVKLPSSNTAKPGPWWRVSSKCPERLEGKSDGLKLRSIGPPTLLAFIEQPYMLWPLPLQPSDIESLGFTSLAPLKPDRPLEQSQMLPFTLNDPQVTGYSACWSNRLLRLHAHRDGEDMSFYQDLDCIAEQPTWIYIPNEPGELVTDIWFRHAENYHHLALLVIMKPIKPCAAPSPPTNTKYQPVQNEPEPRHTDRPFVSTPRPPVQMVQALQASRRADQDVPEPQRGEHEANRTSSSGAYPEGVYPTLLWLCPMVLHQSPPERRGRDHPLSVAAAEAQRG
ncbi:hypothetical protein C8A01DRAFT_14573 [Parachaetomium inaequale]|uniref:Uncharacterized protein n=1 Tax=Parachaetomium inaequale TaxID=2588326 RepID=A0AAN6PIP0_9PEZI|nr:hypothetical protein C8A01DRAFT_14573 [Parachaetomium inaequale]